MIEMGKRMDLHRYRNEFEYTRKGLIFLNHSGVSPLSNRCVQAMQQSIHDSRFFSEDAWDKTLTHYQSTREKIAAMLGVSPNEIAFSGNTTEGINWVANGIDWQAGDRIVSIHGEYPANIYPWMRLHENKGVDLQLIRPHDHRVTLEMIEQALTPGTKLLALSLVEFASGFRFDIEAVGRLCHEKGVLFLVDLIQGLGVIPVDLKKARVAFAMGGAQKWLIGPQGVGYFYCDPEHLSRLEVTTVGATSVAFLLPYLEYNFTLRAGVSRFEYGTLPTQSIVGLGAALDLFLEAGMENVSARIKKLTDLLVEGLTQQGYRCHSPRGETEWSGIISFTHPKADAAALADRLWEKGIFAREREGYLRLAPHFYQTEEEMERVVEVLGGYINI